MMNEALIGEQYLCFVVDKVKITKSSGDLLHSWRVLEARLKIKWSKGPFIIDISETSAVARGDCRLLQRALPFWWSD